MFPIEPVDRLSSTNTSSPRSSSASERCEPMNPAPPVMRTRTTLNPLPGHAAPVTHQFDDCLRGTSGSPAGRNHRIPLEEVAPCRRKLLSESFIIQDPLELLAYVRGLRAAENPSIDERGEIVRQADHHGRDTGYGRIQRHRGVHRDHHPTGRE